MNIDPEYLNKNLTLKPGNRLHRLVAMLFDTYIDDLTDQRIAELEEHVAQFRWWNAAGERIAKDGETNGVSPSKSPSV
jgi:hypothetical protein